MRTTPHIYTLTLILLFTLAIKSAALPVLNPQSATPTDQQFVYTSDYCPVGGTSYNQQYRALQTQEDPEIYIITCETALLVWRGSESTSTLLTFPRSTFLFPPLSIVQHPKTGDIYFPYSGELLSLAWNESTLPTFQPTITQHAHNSSICLYVCNSVSPIFSPDGSHIYVTCGTEDCEEEAPSYLAAIDLTTNQTIYINMTAAETGVSQDITQLSLMPDTSELLILSLMYGITVYDTRQTMVIMQSTRLSLPDASSTATRVLLDPIACVTPDFAIIDRIAGLLIAVCNRQTIVWNLTSNANISVDPQSGVVVYPQTPLQGCNDPSLLYHRPKRTLYQSCGSGPDRVFALQNLDTPQSALFTSLVDVDICSSSTFLMADRTQPDVLYALCYEGVMRMEGRALTPIPIGSLGQFYAIAYDWRTDSTYVMCDTAATPLLRLRNHEVESLTIPLVGCQSPQQLLFDSSHPTSPQLFLACTNQTSTLDTETRIWNISLEIGSAYLTPQLLFILPFGGALCTFDLSHYMFYCIVDSITLWTFNVSTPTAPPQPALVLPYSELITDVKVCSDWLFMISSARSSIFGLPISQIGIATEPQLFFGNLTQPPSGIFASNLACDATRKTVSAILDTDHVHLIRINVTDPANPNMNVFSFDTGVDVNVVAIDVDTELNRVYIVLSPEDLPNTPGPDYLVIFEGDLQRFVPSIYITKPTAPFLTGLFVDSHTSQVFLAINAADDPIYNNIAILTSGWRCTTGTSWYQGECLPCPIAESRSVVLSTSESTYSIPQCVSCAVGSISNVTGTIECIRCSQGRFADITVGQVCSPCVGGYYANHTGSIACSPCESGRFSNASEASSCYAADEGYYVSAEGQSMQFQCPSGRYSNRSGLTFCYSCETGRFAAEYGQSNCTAAEQGYFISLIGQNSPSQCPSGRFSNESGLSFCYACQPGRYTTPYGSSNCTEADPGYYVDHPSQRLQRPCFPGTFNNETEATACQSCLQGTFAASSGSTSCQQCQLGKFSASAASDCPTCSADAYTPHNGAECITCTDQEGLLCINGLASVATGYWPYLINDTSDSTLQVYRTTQCPPGYCDGAILQFANESSMNQSLPQLCQSPRLNSPDNWLCAECEDGYIAWGSSCQPCTGPNVGLILGALILSFVLVYILLRMDPSASPSTILVFFIQIAALELGSITRWIDWIQLSNLGAHSFTHCLAPLRPIHQMILTLCVPFILMLLLGLMAAVHYLISKYATPSTWYQSVVNSPAPLRCSRFLLWCSIPYNPDRYIGTINAILIFCYTSTTVTVASTLHCVDVGPDQSRLFSSPSVDCHSTEYRTVLLPFVYVWLCCYVIGLPLFMLLFVWRRLQTVINVVSENFPPVDGESMHQINESLLSADESAEDISVSSFSSDSMSRPLEDRSIRLHHSASTSSLSFHYRWGHLYRPYRVGAWYWQPIEMMQRFAFALVSILLIQHSAVRYALYGTLTIISLILQLYSRPFVSDRLNQFALINYFLLVFVSFLLSCQQPPYTLGVQLLMFLLIVPFSITLFVWSFARTVIEIRAKRLPSMSHAVSMSPEISSFNLQPTSSSLSFPHRRISHELAQPFLDSSSPTLN